MIEEIHAKVNRLARRTNNIVSDIVATVLHSLFIRFFEVVGVNTDVVIEWVPPMLTVQASLVYYINASVNKAKMMRLLSYIESNTKFYMNLQEDDILERYALEGRKMSIYYAIYMFSSMSIYLIIPAAPPLLDVLKPLNKSRERLLLCEAEYGVDIKEYYYYVLLHQCITCTVITSVLICTDTLYMVSVQHGCALFATVGYHLRTAHKLLASSIEIRENKKKDSFYAEKDGRYFLTSDNRAKIYKKLVACIQGHNRAIRYRNILESSFSTPVFIQILLSLICMSVTGVQTVLKFGDRNAVMRFGSYILAQTTHLFFLCLPGQWMISHSDNMYIDACQTDWYYFPPESKALYRFILMRAVKTSNLTAMNFIILSMETFVSVVQTAMSYFTVLSSVQ